MAGIIPGTMRLYAAELYTLLTHYLLTHTVYWTHTDILVSSYQTAIKLLFDFVHYFENASF